VGVLFCSDMKINSMAVALCHAKIKFHLGPRMSKTNFSPNPMTVLRVGVSPPTCPLLSRSFVCGCAVLSVFAELLVSRFVC